MKHCITEMKSLLSYCVAACEWVVHASNYILISWVHLIMLFSTKVWVYLNYVNNKFAISIRPVHATDLCIKLGAVVELTSFFVKVSHTEVIWEHMYRLTRVKKGTTKRLTSRCSPSLPSQQTLSKNNYYLK